MAEVCVLDHIRVVTSVPHLTQESLSSQRTPTLSYSLPFYDSIISKWGDLKQVYPLLSPYIQIAIQKVEQYVGKSKRSRTYLLAVCRPPFSFKFISMLTWRLLVLNPCLKMEWIETNCSQDDVQRTMQIVLNMVSLHYARICHKFTLIIDVRIQDGRLGGATRQFLRLHCNSCTPPDINCRKCNAFFGSQRTVTGSIRKYYNAESPVTHQHP